MKGRKTVSEGKRVTELWALEAEDGRDGAVCMCAEKVDAKSLVKWLSLPEVGRSVKVNTRRPRYSL